MLQQTRIEAVRQYYKRFLERIEKIGTHHHIFSHIEWDMIGYKVKVENKNQELIWVEKEELLEKYPIPGAFMPFREKI